MEAVPTSSDVFIGDLLPHLVDQRARLTPEVTFAEYPITATSYNEGFRKISYGDFANAVNGAAQWLTQTLGPGKDFNTLAYMGPNDVRYPALILGAVKAGYKLFLPSPRNSIAAQVKLFSVLHCHVLLSSNPRLPAVNALSGETEFRIVEVPAVSYYLDTRHEHFPFDKSWPEAQYEPLFVIHTSGSTGIPKPLTYTHATAATNTAMMSLKPPQGYESQDRLYRGKRVFVTFPPFHGAYLVLFLFNAVPFGTVMIAPLSGALLSGTGLAEALQKTTIDAALAVPSIVRDLAQDMELLSRCSRDLQIILYCGGDLPQPIGDVVASKIRLLNQFGASELGLTPNLLSLKNRDHTDWKYAHFHPDLGLELRPHDDGVYELYAVRDPKKHTIQPTFTVFPDTQEYASRDLFVRHPCKDKADLWCWHARADDIIVFLNGEKSNPISAEQHITSHNNDIAAALVLGAQRFQAALFIEPTMGTEVGSPAARAAFIERIWPTVEAANRDAPAHARLMKTHVLFTQPGKPMLRAGKGTVQRSGTLKRYENEINALYRDADSLSIQADDKSRDSRGMLDEKAIPESVRQSVLSATGWTSLDESADFFGLGMDSLQALVVVRRLRQELYMPEFALSHVYTNPSIPALTATVLQLLKHRHISRHTQDQARTKERKDMIEHYKRAIDHQILPNAKAKLRSENTIVTLTGSTGTLGSYILEALLRHTTVGHIYCLNRADNGSSVQAQRNETNGLQCPLTESRVSFLKSDLSQPNLGMTKDQYEEVVSKTTLFIHNAWSVNFNLSLSSFTAQLDGLVRLLTTLNNSASLVRFFYISSISSLMSSSPNAEMISEQPFTSDETPGPNGYADSKYAAEQIIEHAAQRMSPSASLAFARVGQVAGAANHAGMWNKAEWFPSLIISSLQIGALPESFGSTFDSIDWVPVDILADVIVELANTMEPSAEAGKRFPEAHAGVYHPLNPRKTGWSALKAVVLEELEDRTRTRLEVIPLRRWIAKVRQSIENMVDHESEANDVSLERALRKLPAAKLLDFYEELAANENAPANQLETSEALKLSATMRGMEPVKDEWMRKWIREWFGSVHGSTT